LSDSYEFLDIPHADEAIGLRVIDNLRLLDIYSYAHYPPR